MISFGPAPYRSAGRLTGAVLLTLAAAAMLAVIGNPTAHAQGPAGGYHAPDSGAGKSAAGDDSGLQAIWSAVRAPLRWLRQSSRSFHGLMRLLAERSAHVAGGEGGRPPLPPPSQRPRKEPEKELPRESVYGGEAGAGHDQGARGTRVKEWQKRSEEGPRHRPKAGARTGHRLVSCERAGQPAPRGTWYVVQKGDTLWRIAEVHFGYGEAYLRLQRANSGRVTNADRIYPCQRLYIPQWRCCPFTSRVELQPPDAGHAGEESGG